MQQQSYSIRQATVHDAAIVVELVQQLLLELGGFQSFDTPATISLCEQLLSTAHFTAFLAESPAGSPSGVLTLAEAPALYVSGRLGWIQELYVSPPRPFARRWAAAYRGGNPLRTESPVVTARSQYARCRRVAAHRYLLPERGLCGWFLSSEEVLVIERSLCYYV